MANEPVESFGAYEVYERLGKGGMATVHRAQSRRVPGVPIALKRLLPELSAVPEFVDAFLDEARLARHLVHTNVAQTYDFGQHEGTYYIAMELVRGPTLSELIAQCAASGRAVPLPIALSVIVQLCDALEYAHNLCDPGGQPLGIIHRDVTPSNIIVGSNGITKLIDFGIAKAASSSVRTKTGFIKGKFAYVAPEYIAGKIDPRVDLFAAGIVAHELLAGRKLFQVENDFETLRRVQTLPIEPPSRWNPRVPEALDEVVMIALERDPEQRWQRASAMRNAFAHVARTLPTTQQVADWVAEALGPPPRSVASALTIDIGLLEETIVKSAPRPGFAQRLATRAGGSRMLWWAVAALATIASALAVYLVAT
jgi:eukaryotic-like serine/threonine-protein kinase